MKHTIKVIYGKDQVDKFLSDIAFSENEQEINIREFSFETEAELIAFKRGVDETVGWMECYIVDNSFVHEVQFV